MCGHMGSFKLAPYIRKKESLMIISDNADQILSSYPFWYKRHGIFKWNASSYYQNVKALFYIQ